MNFLNKLFGKKSKQDLRPFITSERTPEQEAMFQEQLRIRDALGFERGNDTQAWLRLHQILLDHEERMKQLEAKTGVEL
jgi:hypothetical protein